MYLFFVLGQYFNFNKDVVVNESDIVSLKGNVNLISMVLEKNHGMKDYEKSTLSEFSRDEYVFNYNLSVISNVTSASITVNVTSKKVANGITKSKGTYNEDVTSDNSSAYPSNGVSGSYWYVRK